MFTIDTTTGRAPRFASFATAADCAVVHARQRGEARVRYLRSGLLVADFRAMEDGTVSVAAAGCDGTALVTEWAA
jgi:hypothetical protein